MLKLLSVKLGSKFKIKTRQIIGTFNYISHRQKIGYTIVDSFNTVTTTREKRKTKLIDILKKT